MATFQQFANNMQGFARDLERNTPHNIVAKTAARYKSAIQSSILSVAPSGKLSGVGGKAKRAAGGTRIGVKYDVKDSGSSSTAIVQATGPLHLIERDNSAHLIPRTTGSKRLRTASGRASYKRQDTGRPTANRGVKFLYNEQKHFAAMGPVSHPGSKGKHPFERGAKAADQAARNDAIERVAATMSKFFTAAS
jgi:hypothetical protein